MRFGDAVAEALQCMRTERIVYKDYVSYIAIEKGKKLINITKKLWEDVLDKILILLQEEIPREYPYQAVWWYSVLCDIKKDPKIFLEFIQYIRRNKEVFSANTLYFLYYQCKGQWFISSSLDSILIKEELWKLFLDIVNEFTLNGSFPLERIPYKERNHEFIVVITEQFTNREHGPTKTALDRCRTLIEKMGKNVLLINTAEIWSNVGAVPFSDTAVAMYAIGNQNIQEWKGTQIPYFKCGTDMPNIESLNKLLLWIRKLAPEWVISIGGSSILSNLVNNMIPVLAVGLTPSDLEFTSNTYQTLSRKLSSMEIEMLQRLGFDENHVIESIFTSGLKSQIEKINRSDIGIEEEKFLILVVGIRLDEEVTDGFLKIMEETIFGNMHLGFLGIFRNYDIYIQKYPNLIKKSSYLGYCKDILSRMELGDLYVNPVRKGGGTSCVEAMYKGLPVVTTSYGDVAVNAGEKFCVENYLALKDRIIRYYTDKEYYQKMSQEARKRAKVLLDTECEFVRIMQEVEKRESLKN